MRRGTGSGIATLVHLNGPPAVGKSTLAERLVDRRPLALCLDIDVLRTRLGRWEQHDESKQIARRLGFALAREHLGQGLDVVLPQLTVRADVVDDLEALAAGAAASFVEVILRAAPAELASRLEPRSGGAAAPHPRDAFTPEALAGHTLHALDALARLAAARPTALVVDVGGMTPDGALAAVEAVLA